MIRLIEKYRPVFAPEGATAGAGAGDGGAAAAAAAAAAAGAGTPWHQGVEAEVLGHWQNKNYDLSDPAKIAVAATKAAIEAQKFVGVPPQQLVRLPADAKDEAGWKSVYNRLGVPADAKDYDLTGVKWADGTDLQDGFTATMRDAMLSARVPKDRAADVVKSVVKWFGDTKAAETAEQTAKIAEEKATLQKNWGTNFEFNKLKAMEGARRLGITPEAVAALESVKGYSAVMEAMRKIGVGTSEDTFVEGKVGGQIMTREGATARKAELMADDAWQKRFLDGGVAERREMSALNQLITGVEAA